MIQPLLCPNAYILILVPLVSLKCKTINKINKSKGAKVKILTPFLFWRFNMPEKTYVVVSVYWNDAISNIMTKEQLKTHLQNSRDEGFSVIVIDGKVLKGFKDDINIDNL